MRLIDADDLRTHINNVPMHGDHKAFYDIMSELVSVVAAAPTIDPVRHARWVCDKGVSACSGCGGEQHYNDWDELEFTPWCHNCGARMDEGGE